MKGLTNKNLKKQQGVVLLTALVFILILLAMLRFTLTSSRVEEQKSAIDSDMVAARESAQLAIKFAEQYVIKQGELYCLNTLKKSVAECSENKVGYAGELFSLTEAELANISNSLAPDYPAINSILQRGFYTGVFMESGGMQACRPFWACVNWSPEAHAVRNSAQQMRIATNTGLPAITCNSCATPTHTTIKPQFIIERIKGSDLGGSAPQFASNSPNAVILRITAVGFGAGTSGNNSSPNTNITNAILQSTYALGG
ncbi:MAG: pilus assembly protein [Neisseria sp.]|jgi:hypothetical protein|nr:MAG: pilus assembly protein [Neisseria sp.]